MLSNIVQDYKNGIEKSNGNVRLLYNQPDKDSFIVEADRERITQVISNLLNNAVKFTEETRGDVCVAAEEKGKADQKVVVVRIKDTGIGIDPEILPIDFLPNLLQNLKQVQGLDYLFARV